ncbi:MAG: hypothetical protein KAV87_50810, partial [Desulfobacteraceae bacterium]|nr:hypothetical protein [Desulfobacteraceae bacterium]
YVSREKGPLLVCFRTCDTFYKNLSAVFMADLPTVILVRHFCGGLEGWTELFREEVIVARIKI